MRLDVVGGIDTDVPKPYIYVSKQIPCDFYSEYYGVLTKDTFNNAISLHIYDTALEAYNKYDEYKKKMEDTLDPVEYDMLKHLKREVISLKPICKEQDTTTDNFRIESVLFSEYKNSSYTKVNK